jgi:DNA-binding NtrC family response regulator
MERRRILVVDDEVNARTALAELLRDEGYDVETVADAFKALGKCEAFAPHVVVTDLKMPGMTGIELIEKLRGDADPPEVVVMTAHGELSSALAAMRAGAAEYLTKPIHFEEFLVVIGKVVERHALSRETRQLRARLRDRVAAGNLVGDAPAMRQVMQIVEQVAPTKAPVLICGEHGTGKELLASAIHQRSVRAARPFVKLCCAGLSDALLASELFGQKGRLALADGGTLFLDEVGELPSAAQIELLRFLQEPTRLDVRVITATAKNLSDAVKAGRFREDLYYRLNIVTVEMPALRDHKSDIPLLAKVFVDRHANGSASTVSPKALDALASYDWPGNVGELEHAIEHAVVLANGHAIEPRHLPANVRPAAPAAPAGMPPIPGSTLDELERYAILESLKATGGSTSKAAEMLGISVRTIQYRLHDYNIAPRAELAAVHEQPPPLPLQRPRPASEPGNLEP